jgi:hypothetical protein
VDRVVSQFSSALDSVAKKPQDASQAFLFERYVADTKTRKNSAIADRFRRPERVCSARPQRGAVSGVATATVSRTVDSVWLPSYIPGTQSVVFVARRAVHRRSRADWEDGNGDQ